jgi:hypothetical protein
VKFSFMMQLHLNPDLTEHFSQSTSAFQAVLESLRSSMDGGQDVLDRERNKYSSKLGEGDAKQDIHVGEKLKVTTWSA